MLKRLYLVMLCFGLNLHASDMTDIVELRDGGLRRGMIVEQIPGKSLTLETSDGSRFVIKESDVKMISKASVFKAASTPKAEFRQEENQVPIEDLGQAVLELRGAWGFPTKYENDINASGFSVGVMAYDLGIRTGYEWAYIGVSLGFDYHRRNWTQNREPYVAMRHSLDGSNVGILSFPLFAEFYVPFGRLKPGLKFGVAYSVYDGHGGSANFNAVIAPVFKFILGKNFDLSLDLRYTVPIFDEDTTYSYDRAIQARTSIGTCVGLRL